MLFYLGAVDSRYIGCYDFGSQEIPLDSKKGALSESVEWCISVCYRWNIIYTGKQVMVYYSTYSLCTHMSRTTFK